MSARAVRALPSIRRSAMSDNYSDQDLVAQLRLDLAEGESGQIEFKAYDYAQLAVSKVAEEWKNALSDELAAFASIGGRIYIGIADDGKVTGLSGSHQAWQEKLFERAVGRIKPKVNWKSYYFTDPTTGFSLIRIDVRQGEPMYYVQGKPYIRDGTKSRPAEPEDVKARFREYFTYREPILPPAIERSQKKDNEQATIVHTVISEQLSSSLEQQIDNRMKAHDLFNEAKQAIGSYNWGIAEERITASLQLHPIKEARSYIGLRMSEALIVAFKRIHELPPGFNYEALYDGVRGRPRFAAPSINQALSWLELAKNQNKESAEKESAAEILMALALMYGLARNYTQMMSNIKEAINDNLEFAKAFFTNAFHLAMLVHGCTDELDQLGAIQRLGNEGGINLPVLPQIVQQSIPTPDKAIYWIVMGQQSNWAERPKPNFPIPVWIRSDEEETAVGTAGYRTPKGNGGQTFIPPDRRAIPLDQVTQLLADDFLFICSIPNLPS